MTVALTQVVGVNAQSRDSFCVEENIQDGQEKIVNNFFNAK